MESPTRLTPPMTTASNGGQSPGRAPAMRLVPGRAGLYSTTTIGPGLAATKLTPRRATPSGVRKE